MLSVSLEIQTKDGFSAEDIYNIWLEIKGGSWKFNKIKKNEYEIRHVKYKGGKIVLTTSEGITFAKIKDKTSRNYGAYAICGSFIDWLTNHAAQKIYAIYLWPKER